MSNPVQPSADTKYSSRPVLIIDKEGLFGPGLAQELRKNCVVVLVTARSMSTGKNLIVIPYKRKIPTIPDNTYSQIIVVFSGDAEVFAMLTPLTKKAEEGRTRVAFVHSLRLGTPALYKRIHAKYHAISFLLTGDVFGGETREYNLINDFLSHAQTNRKIVVPNTGLFKTYPVAHGDAIAGILNAVFVKKLSKKVYFLFPEHPVTALSIARHIKQLHPDVALDFFKTPEKKHAVAVPADGEYLLEKPYPLPARLRSIDLGSEKQVSTLRYKKKHNPYKKPLTVGMLGIFLFFLMPFLATAAFALFGYILLDSGKSHLEKGKYEEAGRSLSYAKNALNIAGETGVSASSIGSLVGLSDVSTVVLDRIATGEKAAAAGELLIDAYLHFKTVQEGESADPKADFVSGMNDLRQSIVLATELTKDEGTPAPLRETLLSYTPAMQFVAGTSELYPSLLGFEGKKIYLILFQNNMELRPGGGFIGSYGLATVDRGRVTDFSIHNVYDADGQLKGHIEPPYPLRRYMGAQHLFLRDSNFSLDFEKNAAQAANLLALATGVKTDGVIALDMTFFRSLFAVTGPVTVPTYNETVDANNVYLVTQRHAEKDFFPGSTQKQDFLSGLFSAFSQKLGERGGVNPLFARKIMDGIAGKHILIAVPDAAMQQVLSLYGASGALRDTRRAAASVLNDTFGIYEANIGGNKANYYLERSFKHDIVLGQGGEVDETVTVTYTNTAKTGSEFGGAYTTYVRFLTPANTELTGIAIDDAVKEIVVAETDSFRYERSSFVPPQGLEVNTTEEGGYRIFGFYLSVPEGATRKISVNYRLAGRFGTTSPFTYSLRFIKQPGAQADPYVLSVKYPSPFTPHKVGEGFEQRGSELFSFGPFDRDKVFSVEFVR